LNKIAVLSDICYSVSSPFQKGNKDKFILKNISIELAKNSITGLIGESGCGKTTLAKIIAGIITPVSGTIAIQKGTNIQLLFQNSEELIHPYRKIINLLNDVSKDKSEVDAICGTLGIETKLLGQKGISLSGGERQRVGLARILLKKPDLILLDEPFSAQDNDSQQQLIDLFRTINKEYNSSLLLISHNIEPVKKLAGEVIVMHKGRIVESGDALSVFNNPMHPYTQFLLKAESYSLTKDEMCSNAANQPAACSFYSSCQYKSNECIKSVKLNSFEKRNVFCNNFLSGNIN
jgi:peptide/nickel transport system ATP-binding protein